MNIQSKPMNQTRRWSNRWLQLVHTKMVVGQAASTTSGRRTRNSEKIFPTDEWRISVRRLRSEGIGAEAKAQKQMPKTKS